MAFYVSDEQYLVHSDTDEIIAGPFPRSAPVIAIITRITDLVGGWKALLKRREFVFYNASRHSLAKAKRFPRSKRGDVALAESIKYPDLAAELICLLGDRSFRLGCDYENPRWVTIDQILQEKNLAPYENGPSII